MQSTTDSFDKNLPKSVIFFRFFLYIFVAEKIGKMTNMKHYNIFFIKTAFLFAVLFCCNKSNAQTYNNWLLDDGDILNFNTNPPSIDKIDFDNYKGNFSLSDDEGKLILYGGVSKSNKSNYIIKNNTNKVLVSFPCHLLINAIGCKSVSPNGSYYVAIVSSTKQKYKTFSIRLYRFDNKGVLIDSLISDKFNYSSLSLFMPMDNGDVYFWAYAQSKKIMEIYKLSGNKMFKEKTYAIELPEFSSFSGLSPNNVILPLKNGEKIICWFGNKGFILNHNIYTDKITVEKEFKQQEQYSCIALSANDKYCIFEKGRKIIRYNISDDFEVSNEKIIYELTDENIISCTDMQLGYDDKIYAILQPKGEQYNRSIIYFDGIETDNITVGTIVYANNFNSITGFPKIPRIIETKSTPCPEIAKPKIICE